MSDDLSSIFEKLNINKDSISPEMVDNIKNLFNGSSDNTSSDSSSSSSSQSDFDIETFLKLKSVMEKMNSRKNDSHSKLLQDLKPYLSPAKQNKIDQCIKISKLLNILPLIGGEVPPLLYDENQALFLSLVFLLF